MSSIQTVTANPTSILSGQVSTITFTLDNQARAITVTLTDENGNTASTVLTIGAEVVALSVDPTKIGTNGHAAPSTLVATASPNNLGTLAVSGSNAFTYTAA